MNIDRARALLEYLSSDYATALRSVDAAIQLTRSASPVSLAGTLVLKARIEIASGDAKSASATLAEAETLFVENGRAGHAQRWYGVGLAGVARAQLGETVEGDAALDNALAKLSVQNAHASFEQTDLALHAGAAARRRGEVADALALHRRAAALQKQIGWLGDLGGAWVDAELALDGSEPGADVEAREHALARLGRSRAILQRVAPRDLRLAQLATAATADP